MRNCELSKRSESILLQCAEIISSREFSDGDIERFLTYGRPLFADGFAPSLFELSNSIMHSRRDRGYLFGNANKMGAEKLGTFLELKPLGDIAPSSEMIRNEINKCLFHFKQANISDASFEEVIVCFCCLFNQVSFELDDNKDIDLVALVTPSDMTLDLRRNEVCQITLLKAHVPGLAKESFDLSNTLVSARRKAPGTPLELYFYPETPHW